jgi:hypothetical protein
MTSDKSATDRTLEFAALILSGLRDSSLKERSLGALLRRDDVSLIGLSIDPSRYDSAWDFFDDYICINLLSKFPNFDLGVDREKVAIEKFLDSERRCLEASQSLNAIRRGRIGILHPIHAVLHDARLKIEHLLGPFNWADTEQYFAFSGGASVDLPRRKGDPAYKFGCKRPSVAAGTAGLARAYIFSSPLWLNHLRSDTSDTPTFDIVVGNRITTVPKNAKTDRVIAIEPTLNMFFQKGIGGLIRNRLRRVGVDLNSQSLNQSLAREGSVDGSLATIDLKSASDTVSLALVQELLPSDWVSAIELCRSPYGVLPSGEKILYRKVSSMGNGYTFELESLIFWALSSAVVKYLHESDRRLAIYGDDIVIPTGCAQLLIDVLKLVGFDTNVDKTFTSGPFRESCGKHYFRGVDVTPIYIRENVDNAERLLWLANSIARMAYRLNGSSYSRDSRLKLAYDSVVETLPERLRCPTVPLIGIDDESLTDVGLGGDFDEVNPQVVQPTSKERRANVYPQIEGYVARGRRREYKKRHLSSVGVLLKAIYCPPEITGPDFRFERYPIFLRALRSRWEVGPALRSIVLKIFDMKIQEGVSACEIPLQAFTYKPVKFVVQRWGNVGPWL